MADVSTLDQTDPTFLADLKESQEYVWRAARWLSSMGFNVTVNAPYARPDPSQMSAYADNGDLEIVQRVEVKRRPNEHFTKREDYPYDTIIVDVAHAWDRARPKPYAYIIFNSDASACFVVMGHTSKSWERIERFDRKRGRKRTFYRCPLDLCSFHTLEVKE